MRQTINKKKYLARIFIGIFVMFFVLVPALSAMCVSPQTGPQAVVAAADSTLLPHTANVPAKDCCLKNKQHLPLDQWTQNCGWAADLLFSDMLKPSGFETQPVHFSLSANSTFMLSKAIQENLSSSRHSLSSRDNSPLFAQKTALLI